MAITSAEKVVKDPSRPGPIPARSQKAVFGRAIQMVVRVARTKLPATLIARVVHGTAPALSGKIRPAPNRSSVPISPPTATADHAFQPGMPGRGAARRSSSALFTPCPFDSEACNAATCVRGIAVDPEGGGDFVGEIEVPGSRARTDPHHERAAERTPAHHLHFGVEVDVLSGKVAQELRVLVADPGDPAGMAVVEFAEPVGGGHQHGAVRGRDGIAVRVACGV